MGSLHQTLHLGIEVLEVSLVVDFQQVVKLFRRFKMLVMVKTFCVVYQYLEVMGMVEGICSYMESMECTVVDSRSCLSKIGLEYSF